MNEEFDIQEYIDPIEERYGRIADIKQALAALDHKTNKYIEGKLTEDEWREIIIRRDEMRAAINVIEKEISELKEARK